jgi:N6-adenosine-specific RNA methylase IME4
MFGYDVIVADPPWAFEIYSEAGAGKSASAHYATMPLGEIMGLRVGELARRDCLLLLWATECMRPQAHAVMTAWGFTYKTALVWRKTTINGKVRVGPGYRARTMHEPILVGVVGNPRHAAFPSLFDGRAREHSRKPEEFFALVEARTPGASRADLFSRSSRPGWDAWGNEAGKFDEVAA